MMCVNMYINKLKNILKLFEFCFIFQGVGGGREREREEKDKEISSDQQSIILFHWFPAEYKPAKQHYSSIKVIIICLLTVLF